MNIKKLKTSAVLLGAGAALTFGGIAHAEEPNAILDLLEQKGVITHDEAQQAKKYYDKQQAEAVVKNDKTKVASWLDAMTWSGDFRLRSEFFGFENNDLGGANKSLDRLRFRIRLRLGMEAKYHDWATFTLRLASGEQGGSGGLGTNPNSANQTLTDDFSRKPIGIDLAYITLQPPFFDNLKVFGGKMVTPIWEPKFNSAMVWDPDVNPEGLGENLEWKFGDKQQFRVFAQAGQFVINEFTSDANDVYLFDQQLGVEAKPNEHVKVTIAGGYLNTQNLKLLTAGTTASKNVGNSTAGGKYLADFEVLYGRGELALTLGDEPFLGTPNTFSFSGQFMHNAKSRYDTLAGADSTVSPGQVDGWCAQVAYGDNKKAGQWRAAYQYKYVEADSIFDTITDDDFGGGGTDRKGHVIEATYAVRDWWQLRTCAFMTQKISGRPNSGHDAFGTAGSDLFRVQIDTMWKF